MIKKQKLIIFASLLALLFMTCKGNYTQKPKGVKDPVVPVKSIFLSPDQSPISLVSGTTHQLNAQVKPDNATNKQLSYVSNKTDIASVDNTGLITAHKVGTANITITAVGGISKTVEVIVTAAHIPVEDISLSPDQSPISLVSGTTHQLNAQVKPDNATNKQLSYVSNKTDIASVDNTGLITAHKVGTANITITAVGGISKTVEVIVTAAHIPVTSIEFTEQLPEQPIELFVGDEYKLEAKAMPEDATNKKLHFATSDSSIAELSAEESNLVKANGKGEATITITSDDNPSITKEVRFKIKIRPPSIRIKQEPEKCKNNACEAIIVIEKINGGIEYKPVILGGGSKWVEISAEITSNGAEDTIHLKISENKTIWDRTAYIKFKNNSNEFVKGEDNKELKVELIQEKNENPKVEIKWVYGIGEPSDDERIPVEIPHSSPQDYHKMPYVFHWYEKEHTKFFNTRKMGPVGSNNGGFPDSSQCWAKSSSNMLHWWFEQNKENIAKYIAKKGITKEDNPELYEMYNPYYKRELPDDQENIKSSIANIFRKKCPNSTNGNWIYSGLRWYIYGLKNVAIDKQYSPALFNDVFGKNENEDESNDPVVAKNTYTKEEFEDVLKDALLNPNSKKAVGVHVHNNGKYGHGITLWGAAFDEEKNVIAIYVCDNNDRENRIFTYGIYYKDDIYADDPEGIVRVYPYLINYNTNMKLNKYVGTLITLDKGEAKWKEWFDKN